MASALNKYAEKTQISSLFSLSIYFLFCVLILNKFPVPIAMASVLAAVVTFIIISALFFLESSFSESILIRTIVDLDNVLADFIFSILMLFLSVISIFIKPRVKIEKGFDNKKYNFLLKKIQKKEWDSVNNTLKQTKENERAFLINALTDQLNHKTCQHWFKLQPECVNAAIIYGNSLISAAWKARGSGTADTVTTKDWELFWNYLTKAREVFEYAAQHDDNDPEPYAGLLIVAKGLGLAQQEAWAFYIQLVKRCESHFQGQMAMLDALNPKWGGSSTEMFSFARSFLKQEKMTPFEYALLPMAHIEQCLYYSMVDLENQADDYFFDNTVIQEINECFKNYYANLSNYPNYNDFITLNIFAYCFYKMEDFLKTQQLTQLIGKNATEYPWFYLSDGFLSRLDTSYSYSRVCKEIR